MNASVPGDRLLCLPRKASNKQGVAIRLRYLPAEEKSQLLAMYLAYQPRNAFQGLPPIKDDVCARWVDDMVRTGIHAVAWFDDAAGESRVVGHVGLFPIPPHKCEMLIAVSPGFQNLGIGTELVRVAIDLAAELGFQRLWLPVDSANVRARHVYEKCGFTYASSTLQREVDMTCDVLKNRRPPETTTSAPERSPIAAPCFLSHTAAALPADVV